MATIKIPYLRQKGDGWHWEPGPALRRAGWKGHALGSDQAKAEARARQLNAEAKACASAPPPATGGLMPIRQLIARWQASPHYTGVRIRTRRDYAYRCRVIDDWCGDAEIADLTRGLVRDWHRACHQQHPVKANRALTMLKQLYEFAIDHEWIEQNPARTIKPLPSARLPVHDWTPEQVRHMIAVADASDDGKGASLFSVGTAIRLNEWLGQRLTDILLMDATQIRGGVWNLAQSKTGTGLLLPLGVVPGLSERIAEQVGRNRNGGYDGGRILISEATGRPYLDASEDCTHFSRRFARVRHLASETMPSVQRLTFQKLRRYAATDAEDAGATEGELNSVGGWRDGSTASKRYRAQTLTQAQAVFEARLARRQDQSEA